jgi:hypothetical protein
MSSPSPHRVNTVDVYCLFSIHLPCYELFELFRGNDVLLCPEERDNIFYGGLWISMRRMSYDAYIVKSASSCIRICGCSGFWGKEKGENIPIGNEKSTGWGIP